MWHININDIENIKKLNYLNYTIDHLKKYKLLC